MAASTAADSLPDVLYHVTFAEKDEEIMAQGLLPGLGCPDGSDPEQAAGIYPWHRLKDALGYYDSLAGQMGLGDLGTVVYEFDGRTLPLSPAPLSPGAATDRARTLGAVPSSKLKQLRS